MTRLGWDVMVVTQTQMFSRDDVLKSIAEFIVCDDQVSCIMDGYGN